VFPHASAGPSFQLAMFAGEVPGNDQSDDAERLAERRGDAACNRDGLAAVLVDGSRVEVEDLRHHPDLAPRPEIGLRRSATRCGRAPPVLLDERREPLVGASRGRRAQRPATRVRLLRARDGLVASSTPACSSSAIGCSVAG
jgi:hypothetical protein